MSCQATRFSGLRRTEQNCFEDRGIGGTIGRSPATSRRQDTSGVCLRFSREGSDTAASDIDLMVIGENLDYIDLYTASWAPRASCVAR